MAIINIGICYQAEVVLQGKRKPSMVNVLTSIPVEIKDIEGTPELIGIICKNHYLTEYRNVNGVPMTPLPIAGEFLEKVSGDLKFERTELRYGYNEKFEDIQDDIQKLYQEKMGMEVGNKPNRLSEHHRVQGILSHKITGNMVLSTDMKPQAGLPIVMEDKIKKTISDNRKSKISILSKQIEGMSIINGELYAPSRGPVFIKDIASKKKEYTVSDTPGHTLECLDISHSDFDPEHLSTYVNMVTSDMYYDLLTQEGKDAGQIMENIGVYISDMEPFRKINQDAPGRLLFNQMFGDMIRHSLIDLLPETYNPKVRERHYDDGYDLTEYYIQLLFKKTEAGILKELKSLYMDAVESHFDFEKVNLLISYIQGRIMSFDEDANKLPNGIKMGTDKKVFLSDHGIFITSSINRKEFIDDIRRIEHDRNENTQQNISKP